MTMERLTFTITYQGINKTIKRDNISPDRLASVIAMACALGNQFTITTHHII